MPDPFIPRGMLLLDGRQRLPCDEVTPCERSLATERAVNATLVRQIQAVRDLKPLRMGVGAVGTEYLDRQQVLRLLSPQNDAPG